MLVVLLAPALSVAVSCTSKDELPAVARSSGVAIVVVSVLPLPLAHGWVCPVPCQRTTDQLRRVPSSVPSSASVALPCSVIVAPGRKRAPSAGAVIVTLGAVLPARMAIGAALLLAPRLSVTVKTAWKLPACV